MSRHHLDAADVGRRLRIARESAGVTQAQAATAIAVARTTVVAMEKGERAVRMEEIQPLARLYGTSVNALLKTESIYVDLVPRFRQLPSRDDDASTDAAKILADLVRAEVELENLLGIVHPRNYPPPRPLMPGDVHVQATSDATELRQRLGLGSAPVRDITSLLELDLGIRVYARRLDSRVSGLFAYDEQIGACILLNAAHPRQRRTMSAAHELGHFVASRQSPEVLYRDSRSQSRAERYANAFAREFLAPGRAVMKKFGELTQGSSRLTRRHVILLAHAFGVSREAMVRRLEELDLTPTGAWDWFMANGGITDDQARQVLGEHAAVVMDDMEAERPTTLRLSLLAAEAWRQELLSEGQLAHLLNLDHVELREILDDVEAEGVEVDGEPKLLGRV